MEEKALQSSSCGIFEVQLGAKAQLYLVKKGTSEGYNASGLHGKGYPSMSRSVQQLYLFTMRETKGW